MLEWGFFSSISKDLQMSGSVWVVGWGSVVEHTTTDTCNEVMADALLFQKSPGVFSPKSVNCYVHSYR